MASVTAASVTAPENDCFLYKTNCTGIFVDGFENVPDTLLIMPLIAMGLLVFFMMIRICFGNHGRKAFIHRQETDDNQGENKEHCCFCWMKNFIFHTSDALFERVCGTDAARYQAFQRIVIFINLVQMYYHLTFMMLNMQGDVFQKSDFGFLTLNNLNISAGTETNRQTLDSGYIWVSPVAFIAFHLQLLWKFRSHTSQYATPSPISEPEAGLATCGWIKTGLYWFLNVLVVSLVFAAMSPELCIILSEWTEETMGSLVSRYFIPFYIWLLNHILMVAIPAIHKQTHPGTTSASSAGCRTVLFQTFFYSWILMILLPSFGITTVLDLLKFIAGEQIGYSWKCVFLPEQSALLINLVIQSSYLTLVDLIRPGDLLKFILRWICSKMRKIQCFSRFCSCAWFDVKNTPEEFEYDQAYASQLVIFHLVAKYAPTSPLISVAGLLFSVLKYAVDRYNLYYVYAPSKPNQNVHTAAVSLLQFGFPIMQLSFFFYLFAMYTGYAVTIWAGILGGLHVLAFTWFQWGCFPQSWSFYFPKRTRSSSHSLPVTHDV